MKNEFIGFYDPTEAEIDDSWDNGIFAFDTNTLLNLYRYTDQTRNDFLAALTTLKARLFLPYQASFEFLSNRNGVINGLENSYSNVSSIFQVNFEKNLSPQINQFKRHPAIQLDRINKLYEEFQAELKAELDTQKQAHPDFKSKDEVLDKVTDLFDAAVGKGFSREELKKIYSEGKDRYAELIPPGYKDLEEKRKKGEQHVYGDLIIWKELINYSKSKKKPLIFVTDDRKEDWWTTINGKIVRPREELIKEFFDLTGIRILIYNADVFLHFAKERGLVPQLKEETINEVKDVRILDEKANYIQTAFTYNTNGLNLFQSPNQAQPFTLSAHDLVFANQQDNQTFFYTPNDLYREIYKFRTDDGIIKFNDLFRGVSAPNNEPVIFAPTPTIVKEEKDDESKDNN